VQDFNSGLDANSGELLLDDEEKTAHFSLPNDPLAAQKLSAALSDLADGTYTVRFQAKDRSGLQGESETGELRVDRTAPTVQAQAVQLTPDTSNDGDGSADSPNDQQSTSPTPTPAARGLFSGPVEVTIEAEDATSGVWGIAYVLNDGPVAVYSEPFTISEDGIHNVRYWAKDNAGNYSSSHRLRVWVRSRSSSDSSDSDSSDGDSSDSNSNGTSSSGGGSTVSQGLLYEVYVPGLKND
jgi:uncharacterized membrane protein YgcG